MVSGAISGLAAALLYGTFLEWFVHRVLMHTPRIFPMAFRTHAIEHHSERRSLKSFYAQPEENMQYKLGESSVIPLLWLLHVPVYWLAAKYFGLGAGIGVAVGSMIYLIGYEFIHFFIHAPRNYWFQQTKMFRWYCEYHRVHHNRARVNYNVVCPLADVLLRTISLESIREEPSALPQMARDTGPLSVIGREPRGVKQE